MLITKEQLYLMVPKATKDDIETFYEPLCKAMEEFLINTPLRIAAFIAQVAHESGNFYYTEEIANGSAYENRSDLGNLLPAALTAAHKQGATTGKYFKGRGLIQITGYTNYVSCSLALNLPLLDNPKLLCEPINACRSAAWFFNIHNCNAKADVGLFDAITKTINGGFSHKEERDANYKLAKQVLDV
jgi:putative chitinase